AQNSPTTNGLISFAQLEAAERQIQQLGADSAAPRGGLLEIDQQIASRGTPGQAAQATTREARAAKLGAVADRETRANLPTAQSAAADMSAQGLSQRITALAARPGLPPADQQGIANLSVQVQQLASQEEALDDRSAERAALVARQRLVSGQVAEANRRV